MARLKNIPATLGNLPLAVGYLSQEQRERDRDRTRRQSNSLRHLYNTRRWRCPDTGVRVRIIDRDDHTCQMCGCLLIGAKHAPNSPVLDHKRPHRGNVALFWDEDNLQAQCKHCHDSTKQAMERAADRGGVGSIPKT